MKAKLLTVVAACAALALPAGAQGATIVPNTTTDELSAGGACSLREAVESINAGADQLGCVATVSPNAYGTNDLITVPPGTYALTIDGAGEDLNQTGDLDLRSAVTIDSTSGTPTLSQAFGVGDDDRIVDVPVTDATVGLNDLVVAGGEATGAPPLGNVGGNILFRGTNGQTLELVNVEVSGGRADNAGAGAGGGIASTGDGADVRIEGESVVTGNAAGGNGGLGQGGGVYFTGSGGSLTVADSQIVANEAGFDFGAGASGRGGGIRMGNADTQTLTLTDATIDGNNAAGGSSTGSGVGGGISVETTGALTLNATGGSISQNQAGGGTGWTVQGQSSGFGGGLDFDVGGGAATLNGVDVLGNEAGGDGDHGNGFGGGLRATGNLVLQGSVVSQNLAGSQGLTGPDNSPDLTGNGGGILVPFAAEADLTVEDSSITANVAGDNVGLGGGIAMSSVGDMEITDSAVTGNSAGTVGAQGGAQGGGISRFSAQTATDTITRTTISGNTTDGAGGGFNPGPEQGAGIAARTRGTFTVDSSAITGNTATGLNGNPVGGGLYMDSTQTGAAGTFLVVNSTIAGNSALSANGSGANGGGIGTGAGSPVAQNPPAITLRNVTLANNGVSQDTLVDAVTAGLGGNLYAGQGADVFDLQATIIAGGTGTAGTQNCALGAAGVIESLGENIEQTTPTQCELDGPGDQVGVDPLLAPLANNGGTTQTMALPAASPAVDSVGTCPPPALDQRGVTRPQGSACDAGAFERALEPTSTTLSCLPSSVTVGATTSCTAAITTLAPPGFPSGTVQVAATGPGSGSLSATSCTLAVLTGTALCKVSYTPGTVGSHGLTATYAGDADHAGSSGSTAVQAVAPAGAPPKAKCKKKKAKKRAAASAKKCKKKKKKK